MSFFKGNELLYLNKEKTSLCSSSLNLEEFLPWELTFLIKNSKLFINPNVFKCTIL